MQGRDIMALILLTVLAAGAQACYCPCLPTSLPDSKACLSTCNCTLNYPDCDLRCISLCSDPYYQANCMLEFCLTPASSSLLYTCVGVLVCMALLATAKVAFTAKPIRLIPAYRQASSFPN